MKTTMHTNSITPQIALAAGLTLCAVFALSGLSQAQGPGNRPFFRPMPTRSASASAGNPVNGQPVYNQGVPGYGVLPNGQTVNSQTGTTTGVTSTRSGGMQGGGASQTPLVVGTIVAGDASTGRILIQPQIQSQANGSNQVVYVSNSTRFVTQTAITTSDLQAGEFVQIQGAVTGVATGTTFLNAATITAGQIPAFLQNNRPIRVGGAISGASSGRANATPPSSATQPSTTTLIGMITSVSPLVIKLNNGASVTINATANAQVTRVSPLLFSNLQVGDQLKATGMTTPNGGFVLTDVAINM